VCKKEEEKVECECYVHSRVFRKYKDIFVFAYFVGVQEEKRRGAERNFHSVDISK